MQTFQVDEHVQWNPDLLGKFRHPREEYGDGPFVVVTVEEVPNTYACGAPLTDSGHRGSWCPWHFDPKLDCQKKTRRGKLGFKQWVTVRPAGSNKPLQRSPLIGGGPASFACIWFG